MVRCSQSGSSRGPMRDRHEAAYRSLCSARAAETCPWCYVESCLVAGKHQEVGWTRPVASARCGKDILTSSSASQDPLSPLETSQQLEAQSAISYIAYIKLA